MAGDYTRLTLDPLRDRAMVLEQQGRVHLDADFNELAGIVERRLRVETRDLVGPAVYPEVEPESFKIAIGRGGLRIGRGRMYVDGLLAENHGTGKLEAEPVWGESRYDDDTLVSTQPYLGSPVAPAGADLSKPQLIYLDVWQRELTAVEDPSIVEPALGVDTCTRVQTAWQVRALELDQPKACDYPWQDYEPWQQLTQPSDGRLSSAATNPPQPSDPCAVAPVGGYRGLENRLYRVEIHDPGGAGKATLKWSRDNGSVATRVTAINGTVVTVERLGRDDVLRFHADEWVELLDDVLELDRKPGVMARVLATDPTQSTVMLVATPGTIDVTRNARMRRWDQTAGLDANGLVALPALPATIKLEDGIEVTLSLATAGGSFHTGDWWVFAARAATASVEQLAAAPPRGVRHHFAPLATTYQGEINDCRVPWPGECEGGACDCEACVTPVSHGSGALTIQAAIDNVIAAGGGRVCLASGRYDLDAPLTIASARSLTLTGAGAATRLVSAEPVGVLVKDSVEVSLERFMLLAGVAAGLAATPPTFAGGTGTEIAIALLNTLDCRVQRCFVIEGVDPADDETQATVGIGLAGWALRTRLVDNVILADVAIGDVSSGRTGSTFVPALEAGVVALTPTLDRGRVAIDTAIPGSYLVTADLAIEDNLLLGIRFGIDFGSSALGGSDTVTSPRLHGAATRIERNCVLGGGDAGISLLGITVGGGGEIGGLGKLPKVEDLAPLLESVAVVVVGDNVVSVTGHGIRAGVEELRVEGNTLHGGGDVSGLRSGIQVVSYLDLPEPVMRFADNAITEFGWTGIAVYSERCAVEVTGNRVTQIGVRGIVVEGSPGARLIELRVEDNVLAGVGLDPAWGGGRAIILSGAERVLVRGNLVRSLVAKAESGQNLVIALNAQWCRHVQIDGNQFDLEAEDDFTGPLLGIYAINIETLRVVGNTVAVRGGEEAKTVALAVGVRTLQHAMDITLPTELPDRELLVCGNILHSTGRPEPTVLIAGELGVTLSDNRCRWLSEERNVQMVFVNVAGPTIVSSNSVDGPSGREPAVDLRVPAVDGVPLCTVLGNITGDTIWLNGSALKAPWAPLNIVI